jgi:hypothetical protein
MEDFPKHREEGFPAKVFFDYLEMLNDRSGSLREDRHKFVDYCETWGILPRSVAYGKVTASPGLPPTQRLNAWARKELQPGWTYDDEFVVDVLGGSPAPAIGHSDDDYVPFAQSPATDETYDGEEFINALEDSFAPAMDDAYDGHVPSAQSPPMDETGETASHASQGPEISKDDWKKKAVAAEVRSAEMLADIYAAVDGLWLGTEDTMAMSMAATINAVYNGRAAAFGVTAALTGPGAPASPMRLSRGDFLSLWGQNWLTDELINVILGILFPLRSNGVICLADTTRFNALITSTHRIIEREQPAGTAEIDGFDQEAPPFYLHEEADTVIQQGQRALSAKIDEFDPGAPPPFNLYEEVDAVVGVMNYRDLHWFV